MPIAAKAGGACCVTQQMTGTTAGLQRKGFPSVNRDNSDVTSAKAVETDTVSEISADTPLVQQPLTLEQLQSLISRMFSHKDSARGVEGTFMWLMEEVGELAAALREGDPRELRGEFADVLAWVATIANICDVDLGAAVAEKYGSGCPGCRQAVCVCGESIKP